MSVLMVVWAWVRLPRVFVCVRVCVCVSCVGGVRCGAVWCVGGVMAGVWCGWSLATPGGGSCVLLPATPGWVSLPVVVGVPRHFWLRLPGAVPRHFWLGSAGGGGVRLPATPGSGPPVVVVCLAGWGCPLLCVFVARVAVRGGRAVLCVACLWCPRCWWCGVVR